MINQLTKRNIMKNLISRTALCGIMLVTSGDAKAPVPFVDGGVPRAEVFHSNMMLASSVVWDAGLIMDWCPLPEKETADTFAVVVPKKISSQTSSKKSMKAEPKSSFETHKSLITFDKDSLELYELAINFIKFHEGYCPSVYHCVAGYPTIGYGHVVQPYDKFPERVSRDFADRLVRRDFDKSIKSALKYSPHLKGHQLIAVAHFCFAKGPGRYQNSRLRKIIDSGGDPSDEFMKWCKYHTPEGELVTSQYCRKIREWEVIMYNAGFTAEPANEPIPEIPEKPIEILDTIPNIYISEI